MHATVDEGVIGQRGQGLVQGHVHLLGISLNWHMISTHLPVEVRFASDLYLRRTVHSPTQRAYHWKENVSAQIRLISGLSVFRPGEDASLLLALVLHKEADGVLGVAGRRMCYDVDILTDLERVTLFYLLPNHSKISLVEDANTDQSGRERGAG
jgi:hypothetical protein